MTQEQLILFKRSLNIYNTETEAWTALDNLTHIQGQPVVAFFRRNSDTHGDTALGAIFAIGTANGVGKYKACSSHDDMFAVAQALNTHISEWTSFKATFDKMFEYDANHKAIKAKLDFYTDSNKNISAGGLGGSGSSSLGALYQLVDVMINSTGDGVEGAVEGSVLAYDATAGKWKAISQSEILPDMSGYYTKDETDSAINTAKSNLQGQVDIIKALIPATASADNQLADKDFVNSSIATATAEFRGSFTSLDELKATSGNLNDYAFYLHSDSVGNSIVDRYKWTTAGWLYEYTLNNSSFTAAQWAALNSAITATLVQSYNSHLNNTTIHITSDERTKWNNKWDYNEETIKGVKVNAAINADQLTSDAGTSAIPIYFDGGIPVQCTPSALFYGFANGYDASAGGRVLGITIAGHTRKLVVAYSTLAGSADKLATARTLWGKPFDGSDDVSGDLTEVGNISASGKATIQGDIISGGEIAAVIGEGTPVGVTDYSALTGKPSINGVTLVSGNNTLASLGIQAAGDYATISGVTTLLADYATKVFVSNNYAGKAAFNAHTADTDIHITSVERIAWNAKWNYNEATIKAVKVTSASSADSVAWTGISGKPSTFTPSAHTHTVSEISGLPTKLSAFTNDVGYITGITKSMVEEVLTGDITSHTHSYLPLSGGVISGASRKLLLIKNTDSQGLSTLWLGGNFNNFSYGAVVEYSADNNNLSLCNFKAYSNNTQGIASFRITSDNKIQCGDANWQYHVYNILHSGNYSSYALPLSGGTISGSSFRPLIIDSSYDGITELGVGNKTTIYSGFGYNNGYTFIGREDGGAYPKIGIRHSDNTPVYSPNNFITIHTLIHSGNIGSQSVASATKLQTPRTIWGQPFDGMSDVNGDAHITGDLIVDGEVSALVA